MHEVTFPFRRGGCHFNAASKILLMTDSYVPRSEEPFSSGLGGLLLIYPHLSLSLAAEAKVRRGAARQSSPRSLLPPPRLLPQESWLALPGAPRGPACAKGIQGFPQSSLFSDV